MRNIKYTVERLFPCSETDVFISNVLNHVELLNYYSFDVLLTEAGGCAGWREDK